jgi:hypothetical protein
LSLYERGKGIGSEWPTRKGQKRQWLVTKLPIYHTFITPHLQTITNTMPVFAEMPLFLLTITNNYQHGAKLKMVFIW